ncbi:O-antigen translocase [Photobacterium damselae]|uniref:O-antigen translocase n=1 Tax=Photobacterium damselae TaxID=38293 RepID=UPI003D7D403B
MNILRFFSLSLLANFIKIISGIVINKTIAVMIGPSGLVVISQFQNFIQIIYNLSKLGINGGVTKLTAQFYNEELKLQKIWFTALTISIISSMLMMVIVFFGRFYFSILIFNDVSKSFFFIPLSISIIFVVLNSLYLSIINGQQKITLFIKINILQSILSLIITVYCIYIYGLNGAIFSLSLNQSLIFFLVILFVLKKNRYRKINLMSGFSTIVCKELSKFSLMAIISSLLLPLNQSWIRHLLVNEYSEHIAGIWQGVNYLSLTFITLITSSLSIYYLPKISGKSKEYVKKEVFAIYKLVLPMSIISVAIIYFSRDIIIYILFSPEFKAMRDLFLWQFIGDFIRINTFPLSYLLVSNTCTKKYIASEVLLYGFYGLSVFIFLSLDSRGDFTIVPILYFASCVFYSMYIYVSTRKYLITTI